MSTPARPRVPEHARKDQLIRLVAEHAAKAQASRRAVCLCDCDLCTEAFKQLEDLGWDPGPEGFV